MIFGGIKIKDDEGNKYEVMHQIGSGGFGNVFKLKKIEDNTIYALKTINAPLENADAFDTLVNEVKIAMNINHKNVVKYHYFHDGNTYNLPVYIIMEYLKDGTLENLIKNRKTDDDYFDNDTLLKIYFQLIDGMSKINENIVHRDIKPSNILIQDDLLKITDFGISKLVDEATRTKTFKGWGSSPYIAPEGWKLKQNSIQMDIYSMGIVFYELATLKYPYKLKEETENDYKEAHLFKAPISPIERNPQISSVIAQVILGMLEKKVEDRFNNWGEIKDFLINGAEENINENPLVENILKDRLAKDEKKEKQNLQKEKRKKEIEDFKREIEFMIKDDIINTLRKIINQLNRKYNKGNIHIGKHNRFSYSIITFDNKRIKIEMSPIIKENFYKDIKYSNHGMTVQKTELRLPEYKNKKIKAWGYIKAPDGRGINLILLPQEEMDMYGKWYMLVNRCSAMYGEKRPTPFPFEFNEIGKEIKQINAVHIYNTDVQPLDINYIVKEFIGKYI